MTTSQAPHNASHNTRPESYGLFTLTALDHEGLRWYAVRLAWFKGSTASQQMPLHTIASWPCPHFIDSVVRNTQSYPSSCRICVKGLLVTHDNLRWVSQWLFAFSELILGLLSIWRGAVHGWLWCDGTCFVVSRYAPDSSGTTSGLFCPIRNAKDILQCLLMIQCV